MPRRAGCSDTATTAFQNHKYNCHHVGQSQNLIRVISTPTPWICSCSASRKAKTRAASKIPDGRQLPAITITSASQPRPAVMSGTKSCQRTRWSRGAPVRSPAHHNGQHIGAASRSSPLVSIAFSGFGQNAPSQSPAPFRPVKKKPDRRNHQDQQRWSGPLLKQDRAEDGDVGKKRDGHGKSVDRRLWHRGGEKNRPLRNTATSPAASMFSAEPGDHLLDLYALQP